MGGSYFSFCLITLIFIQDWSVQLDFDETTARQVSCIHGYSCRPLSQQENENIACNKKDSTISSVLRKRQYSSAQSHCSIQFHLDLVNASLSASEVIFLQNTSTLMQIDKFSIVYLSGCTFIQKGRNAISTVHSSFGKVLFSNISANDEHCQGLLAPLTTSPSSDNSFSPDGFVGVTKSRFCSVSIRCRPFIACSAIHQISLSSSILCNISTTQAETGVQTNENAPQCISTIYSCVFETVSGVYTNGIAPGVEGLGLELFNNTHQKCKNEMTKGVRRTEAIDTTISYEEFANMTTPIPEGKIGIHGNEPDICGSCVFMYGNNIASLKISHSTFCNCSASYIGGAIVAYSIGSLAFSNCSFNNCKSSSHGGAVFARAIRQCYSFSDLVIDNCSSSVGGGIVVYDGIQRSTDCVEASEDGKKYMCHNNTETENCGKDVFLNDTNGKCVNESPFVLSCTLTDGGSQLIHCNASCHANDEWLPYGVSSRIVEEENGKDSDLCGCFSNEVCRTMKHAIENSMTTQSCAITMLSRVHTLFATDGVAVNSKKAVVRGEGEESTSLEVSQIDAMRSLFEVTSGSLTVELLHIAFACDPKSSLARVSENEGELILTSLEIDSESESLGREFESPLVVMAGGHLIVSDSKIRFFKLAECSLLTVPVGSYVQMSNTTIANITRSQGSGSVLEHIFGEGERLRMDGCIVENCRSRDDGGCFKIDVDEENGIELRNSSATNCACSTENGKGGWLCAGTVKLSTQMVIGGMKFSGCEGWKGKCVFVEAPELARIVSKASFNFSIDGMSDEDLMGYEGGNGEFDVCLWVYFVDVVSPGYVGGGTAHDFSGCGVERYPCSTISKLVNARHRGMSKAIVICAPFEWTEPVTMNTDEWDVRSETNERFIDIGFGADASWEGLVETSVRCSFSDISFEAVAKREDSHTSVFICADSALTLTRISVKAKEEGRELNYGVVFGKKGVICISSFSIKNVQFASAAMFGVSGENSHCRVEGISCLECSVSGERNLIEVGEGACFSMNDSSIGTETIIENSGIAVEEGKGVEMRNVSVKGIRRRKGNGGGLRVRSHNNVMLSSSIIVDCCSFEECEVNEGGKGGGGMWISAGPPSVVRVSSCSFLSCTSPFDESVGFGGGIFFSLTSPTTDYVISGPIFSADQKNRAKYGTDLFVESEKLGVSTTNATLPFLKEMSLDDVNSMCGYDGNDKMNVISLLYFIFNVGDTIHVSSAAGLDVAPCGFAAYPCKTIQKSLQRQEGSAKSMTLHGDYELLEDVLLCEEGRVEMKGTEERSIVNAKGGDTASVGVITLAEGEEVESMIALLSFRVGGSVKQHIALISQESAGCLRVSSCDFAQQPGEAIVGYSLLKCMNGQVEMKSVDIRSVRFSMSQIIICEQNAIALLEDLSVQNTSTTSSDGLVKLGSMFVTMSMKRCTFEARAEKLSCVVKCESAKTVELENCTFSNYSEHNGNGSAVECKVRAGSRVMIVGGKASHCGCIGGFGGGIFAHVEMDGKLGVGNSSGEITEIANCRAEAQSRRGGFGGGISVSVDEGFSSFAIENVGFSGCSASQNGKNVLVEAWNLSKAVTVQTLNFGFNTAVGSADLGELCGFENENALCPIPLALFFRKFSGRCYVGGGGVDYRLCGYQDYPCQTIGYAGASKFNSSAASIILQSTFTFRDQLLFDSQDYEIFGEENATMMNVAGGEGEKEEGFIEVRRTVGIGQITFRHPASLGSNRSSLMLCDGGTLNVVDCSCELNSGSGLDCSFSYFVCKGGQLGIERFEAKNIKFGFVPLMVVRKSESIEARVLMRDVSLENVSTKSEAGVVEVDGADKFEMNNCSVSASTCESCSLVSVARVKTMMMGNSTMSDFQRTNGFGGVVVAVVEEGEKTMIEKCTFEGCSIEAANMKGGVGYVSVGGGGEVVFDSNTISNNSVDGETGFGGGLHVELETSEVKYSFKKDEFEGNEAKKGKHLYLICPLPRETVDPLRFDSSFREDMRNEDVWVKSGGDGPAVDETLKKYLFASSEEIMFVDDATGDDRKTCGTELYPCKTVDDGFLKMKSNQTTIHVVGAAVLGGRIDRNGTSLTVRGAAEISTIDVEDGGCIVLKKGKGTTTLTLSSLRVILPGRATEQSLVAVSVGRMTIRDSNVEGKEANGKETDMWVGIAEGGEMQLVNVSVKDVVERGKKGVILMKGGELYCEALKLKEISADGEGLIWVREDADASLNHFAAENCEVGSGSIVCLKGVGGICSVSESRFENCSKLHGDGGAIWCEIGKGKMTMNGTMFDSCSVDALNGYGGAVYMKDVGNTNHDFVFSDLNFMGNGAFVGKDMFVMANSLNESIAPSKFIFEYFDDAGSVIADLKGMDADLFSGEPIDLLLLLKEAQLSTVHISSEGMDILGCGMEEHPCAFFWRAYRNLNALERNRNVVVYESTMVDNHFDASSLCVKSKQDDQYAMVVMKENITETNDEWIFLNEDEARFERIMLAVPSRFSSNIETLILSRPESGSMTLLSCVFESINSTNNPVEFNLIRSESGLVSVDGCSVDIHLFARVPFEFHSSVSLNGLNATNIQVPSSITGGAMHAVLMSREMFNVNRTNVVNCSCSTTLGRGGGLYVDCSQSQADTPIGFCEGVAIQKNEAFIGSDLFVASFDLNKTVTPTTFMFSFDDVKHSPTMFCGSDKEHTDTDLFRFLEGFRNARVFVSSKGYDVMRCGSEEDPCLTLWKGMGQIETGSKQKRLFIEGWTEMANRYDFSNFVFEPPCDAVEEHKRSVLQIVNHHDGEEILGMNERNVSFNKIDMEVFEDVWNRAGGVIVSENGVLSFSDCSLKSIVSAEKQIEICFVQLKSGVVDAEKLIIESMRMKQSIVMIEVGSNAYLKDIEVKSCMLVEGCVVQIVHKVVEMKNGDGSTIEVNGSVFGSITRSGMGSSVLESGDNCEVLMKANNSVFELCRSSESRRGGVMCFELNNEGLFVISNSKVMQCGCSTESGRGGGMYLSSHLSGKLLFLFQGMKFEGNVAETGKDIFVECTNISEQINESQFRMDLREGVFNRIGAIYGIDLLHSEPVDLISFITVYQSSIIFVNGKDGKGRNDRQCGSSREPCMSIGYGFDHLVFEDIVLLVIDGEGVIEKELDLDEISVQSRSRSTSKISFDTRISASREYLLQTKEHVELSYLEFLFPSRGSFCHNAFLCSSSGSIVISSCIFHLDDDVGSCSISEVMRLANCNCTVEHCIMENIICEKICQCENAEVSISDLRLNHVDTKSCFCFSGDQPNSVLIKELEIENTVCRGNVLLFCDDSYAESGQFIQENIVLSLCEIKNISMEGSNGSVLMMNSHTHTCSMANCSFSECRTSVEKGALATFSGVSSISVDSCVFEGQAMTNCNELASSREICHWNGSLVDICNSSGTFEDTTISKGCFGGMTIFGGDVTISESEFVLNNPSIEGYPSARRNVICEGNGELNVVSVKGGDGMLPDTSLWILNDGCNVGGIMEERASSFFIPVLDFVATEENGSYVELTFKGSLLLPCNLSFDIVSLINDVKAIDHYLLEESGYVNETEMNGKVPLSVVADASAETEVCARIVFGNHKYPSFTTSFVLKNRSESAGKGDEKLVKGEKEVKSSWAVFCLIFVVLFLIVLIVSVIFIVRWRKQKRRTKELEEIVNDTVRKDPKAFEMVTMEMSPEEQWRRAEKEAEKKNEERIKKRVYDTNMQHSESSEHLLSESGSTEYILGRDSDKIPQWMLEKVDEKEEEEETRKRTPSPSISSTSTTDSDSTFVRSESMCPTTSSMSNLVDAMACSSPHEKLIVDLRDSLFMLLHGLNKTKEMAIGTLQEREQTAAQILFWVANLALHSFDEMENGLSSLSTLSPHIVLFSEHMIICIVMHSDFSSDDDSDSSSISSSTVVTSASDNDDDSDSLPSSAFEDDEYNRKECLRWKAPELLMNKKMGATKESVVFSIGMMLWECLTLQIPFGEYEGEVAGQKIVNGERPNMEMIRRSRLERITKTMISHSPSSRITLADVKKGLFELFPLESKMVTISDAIEIYGTKEGEYECGEAGDGNVDGDRQRQQGRSTVTETEAEEDQSAKARSEEKEIRISFFQ
ncbi:uncharacterized protein MONOS_11862fu11863 [Monocercomonoides exilis]|uniref:uncharacterized protein n=1 Tax=Monocercomonoides exilis TaxID=2049356 RepID=UPI00355AA2EE|nr:hypothetical protein MONOS_11862fu11863 [Monocercomonoides exilis]